MIDTIAAISTPPGSGGIAVIRVSGSSAVAVTDKIFLGRQSLMQVPTHTVHYGKVIDPENCTVIDDALFSVFPAPRSYTGEDTVEISVHGSPLSASATLRAALKAGARMAQAGEFTKRAFLNGKLDLAQAEAVIDVITAKTSRAHENAVSQLEGHLSETIQDIRERLLDVAAAIGVSADYTDEGFDEDGREGLLSSLSECKNEIGRLIDGAKYGSVIKEGILTAIAGPPNVGKSSLLNMLAGSDRAIVTEIAGTTRDVVEENVELDGMLLRLADTAGIRDTSDGIEKIGIERSYAYMENADLVLIVIDLSQQLSEEDKELFAHTEHQVRIIVLNKTDLPPVIDESEIAALAKNSPIVRISAKNKEGISELAAAVKNLFKSGSAETASGALITNARQSEALMRAREHLSLCTSTLESGECVDLVSIDLNDAISALGEIVGLSVMEEVVDRIFSKFCVGK